MDAPLSGLIDLDLRAHSGIPLTQQFYAQMRRAILDGVLAPGCRLPSSRDLARHLQVSRNTVSVAIEQLAMEGYLEVAQGRRPTVASASAPPLATGRAGPQTSAAPPAAARVSRWAQRLSAAEWPFMNEGMPRPFLPCPSDARPFPHDVWARCLRRAARLAQTPHIPAANSPALQAALLAHLAEHRGVKAEARQVLILPSAQAGIELIARVLLEDGDIAWIEDPGYGGGRAALSSAGADVRGVPLDEGGLNFQNRQDRPQVIFVTPSHQYPTGRLMPVGRRQELLAFAAQTGAAIIEDDYDSEFHYDARPVAALQGLDSTGSVFYVGTFSKSTLAEIRSGYIVVPAHMVAVFEKAQRHCGQIVASTVQDALAHFITDGHFAAHVRKMTRLYRGRRDRLVAALARVGGRTLTVVPPAGGMQLLVPLDPRCDDVEVAARLAEAGVTARPLSRHFIGEITTRGLFLGFAAWNDAEIDAGVDRIGTVLREMGLIGPGPEARGADNASTAAPSQALTAGDFDPLGVHPAIVG